MLVVLVVTPCSGPFWNVQFQPGSQRRIWWRHKMEIFSVLLVLCAGNHRSPVNSPHKGQWRGALMFSLIYAWINGWVNNHETGDLRCHHTHYDVTVMSYLWASRKPTPLQPCLYRTSLTYMLSSIVLIHGLILIAAWINNYIYNLMLHFYCYDCWWPGNRWT